MDAQQTLRLASRMDSFSESAYRRAAKNLKQKTVPHLQMPYIDQNKRRVIRVPISRVTNPATYKDEEALDNWPGDPRQIDLAMAGNMLFPAPHTDAPMSDEMESDMAALKDSVFVRGVCFSKIEMDNLRNENMRIKAAADKKIRDKSRRVSVNALDLTEWAK